MRVVIRSAFRRALEKRWHPHSLKASGVFRQWQNAILNSVVDKDADPVFLEHVVACSGMIRADVTEIVVASDIDSVVVVNRSRA